MKRLWLAIWGILLGVVLSTPALAAKAAAPHAGTDAAQVQAGPGAAGGGPGGKHESAKQRRRDALQQREALKARRDAGMKVRAQHIAADDPGAAVVTPGR